MGASTKQKEPSKRVAAKGPRATEPAAQPAPQAPRVQAATPRPATEDLRMPDLSEFGVSTTAAQAHVIGCESCGRAYRHVAKNPKDVTALGYFGRNLASCLTVNAPKRVATEGHAAH